MRRARSFAAWLMLAALLMGGFFLALLWHVPARAGTCEPLKTVVAGVEAVGGRVLAIVVSPGKGPDRVLLVLAGDRLVTGLVTRGCVAPPNVLPGRRYDA